MTAAPHADAIGHPGVAGAGAEPGGGGYFGAVLRGAVIVEAAMVATALSLAAVVAWASGRAVTKESLGGEVALYQVIGACVTLVGALGWWMVTRAGPGTAGYDTARRVLRWTLAGSVLLQFAAAALHQWWPGGPHPTTAVWIGRVALGVISWGFVLAAFVAAMLCVRGIARRLGNERLGRRALLISWAAPAMTASSLILTQALVLYSLRESEETLRLLKSGVPPNNMQTIWLLPVLMLLPVAAFIMTLAVVDRFRATVRRAAAGRDLSRT